MSLEQETHFEWMISYLSSSGLTQSDSEHSDKESGDLPAK